MNINIKNSHTFCQSMELLKYANKETKLREKYALYEALMIMWELNLIDKEDWNVISNYIDNPTEFIKIVNR